MLDFEKEYELFFHLLKFSNLKCNRDYIIDHNTRTVYMNNYYLTLCVNKYSTYQLITKNDGNNNLSIPNINCQCIIININMSQTNEIIFNNIESNYCSIDFINEKGKLEFKKDIKIKNLVLNNINFQLMSNINNLKYLSLRNCQIKKINNCQELIGLDIYNTNIETITNLPNLKSIKVSNSNLELIKGCKIVKDIKLIKIKNSIKLLNCPSLEILKLLDVNLTGIENCNNLKILTANKLQHSEFEDLSKYKNLKHINLKNTITKKVNLTNLTTCFINNENFSFKNCRHTDTPLKLENISINKTDLISSCSLFFINKKGKVIKNKFNILNINNKLYLTHNNKIIKRNNIKKEIKIQYMHIASQFVGCYDPHIIQQELKNKPYIKFMLEKDNNKNIQTVDSIERFTELFVEYLTKYLGINKIVQKILLEQKLEDQDYKNNFKNVDFNKSHILNYFNESDDHINDYIKYFFKHNTYYSKKFYNNFNNFDGLNNKIFQSLYEREMLFYNSIKKTPKFIEVDKKNKYILKNSF